MQNSHVHRRWLPTDFLQEVPYLGQPYGFATSSDTDYFARRPRGKIRAAQDEDDEWEPKVGIQSLKIQMSGTDASCLRVEPRGRLIKEEHPGGMRQRQCDAHALAHDLREAALPLAVPVGTIQ